MPDALAAFQRAQLTIDEKPDDQAADTSLILARVDLQLKIGTFYSDLHDFDKSVVRLNDALRMLDAALDALTPEQLNSRKVRASTTSSRGLPPALGLYDGVAVFPAGRGDERIAEQPALRERAEQQHRHLLYGDGQARQG
jgi:hypothetical protein